MDLAASVSPPKRPFVELFAEPGIGAFAANGKKSAKQTFTSYDGP
jgi:hypothetical protein